MIQAILVNQQVFQTPVSLMQTWLLEMMSLAEQPVVPFHPHSNFLQRTAKRLLDFCHLYVHPNLVIIGLRYSIILVALLLLMLDQLVITLENLTASKILCFFYPSASLND